jgi:hypothetical protein
MSDIRIYPKPFITESEYFLPTYENLSHGSVHKNEGQVLNFRCCKQLQAAFQFRHSRPTVNLTTNKRAQQRYPF